MSDSPDFRLETSELRAEDEFAELGPEDLEYYVDYRGTFHKVPLCPDEESLAAGGAAGAVVGGPADGGDAGDAPVASSRHARGLRVIHEKVFRVARTGAIPIVLGGDHSITYPSAAALARHGLAGAVRGGPL